MTLTPEEMHRLNHPYQTKAGRAFRQAEEILTATARHIPGTVRRLSFPAAATVLALFNAYMFQRGGAPW